MRTEFLGIPWINLNHSNHNSLYSWDFPLFEYCHDQPTTIKWKPKQGKNLSSREDLKHPCEKSLLNILYKCSLNLILFNVIQPIRLIHPNMKDFCKDSWSCLGRSLNWLKRRSYNPRDVGSTPARSIFFPAFHILLHLSSYWVESHIFKILITVPMKSRAATTTDKLGWDLWQNEWRLTQEFP